MATHFFLGAFSEDFWCVAMAVVEDPFWCPEFLFNQEAVGLWINLALETG